MVQCSGVPAPCPLIPRHCTHRRGPVGFTLLGAILLGAMLLGAVMFAGLPSSALAQSGEPAPQDLAELGWLGEAVALYVEAFIAEDADGLDAFVTQYRDATSLERTPAETRVQRQLQIRGMLGAVSLVAIKTSSASELRIIVHTPTMEGYFELFFEESETEPKKIGSMGMQPSAPPETLESAAEAGADGGPSAMEMESLPFSEWLSHLRDRHAIPALAVAWSDGESTTDISSVVIGVRNRETGETAAETDRFHLGSITKSMTASMIARLVNRGELDFSLTIGEAFAELEIQEAYRDVTLAMLLQHQAGIDPLLNPSPEREAAWREISTDPSKQRLALVREVLAQEPSIRPGTGMLYFNAGYVVAAAMAERAAEEGWESLIQSEVFEPLKLRSAGLGWPVDFIDSSQPRGHWVEGGVARPHRDDSYAVGMALAPAGDVHASITDLAYYGAAHLASLNGHEAWITQPSMKRLHALPEDGQVPGYAMGWMLEEEDGVIRHLHAGSAGTFYAFLCLIPETGLVVAVSMNDGDFTNDAVAREILARLQRDAEAP